MDRADGNRMRGGLLALAASDRPVILAERVVLSRTRVSRIVDELLAAGLVRRQSNPDDGRSAFAVLTADGLARYRAAAPIYLAAIENEFGAGLTDDELAAVGRALRKVITWPITPGRAR